MKRRAIDSRLRATSEDRRWGWSRQCILWARKQAQRLRLKRSESDVLAMVASYCDELGRGFRLCIGEISRLSLWSVSTVKRALRHLRELGLIFRSGQIPVKDGRPVVVYDLGSTPDCPLPEGMIAGREALRGVPDWVDADLGFSRSGAFLTPTKELKDNRPCGAITFGDEYIDDAHAGSGGEPQDQNLAATTRAQTGTQPPNPKPAGSARRPPHLRKAVQGRARSLAAAFLASWRPPTPGEDVVTYREHSTPAPGGPVSDGLFELPNLPAKIEDKKPAAKRKAQPAIATGTEDAFNEFWAHWPRKVQKPHARRTFVRIVEVEGVDPKMIIEAAEIYGERWRLIKHSKDYTPHPGTWLNGEGWNDDIDDVLPLPQPVRSRAEIIRQQNMEHLARTLESEGMTFQDIGKPKPPDPDAFDPWR